MVDVGFSTTQNDHEGTHPKSSREELIKARLGVLALAQELENIGLACKRAGISKGQFYEIKAAYEKYGSEGLAPHPKRETSNAQPDSAGSGRAHSQDD